MARVGVMFNLKGKSSCGGEPPDLEAEFDSEATVLSIAHALETQGHDVCLIEGDKTAYSKLLSEKIDIVFNICEGLKGESRESHIPSILEMLGIPYTGSGVLTLAVTLDKHVAKKILAYHDIPTAKFQVFSSSREVNIDQMKYPLFVKPVHEGSSMGISSDSLCKNYHEVLNQVDRITNAYRQPALVEEFLSGREFTVGIIGNQQPNVFPIMEINFDNIPCSHGNVYSRKFKTDWSDHKYYSCPANLPFELEEQVKQLALRTFRIFDCKDFARIDIRLDNSGVPNVIEVNPLPGMAPGFSDYPRIAEQAGVSYQELVNMILMCALKRYNLFHLTKIVLPRNRIA